MHPTITTAIATQHHHDLLAAAHQSRRARLGRANRPAPVRLTKPRHRVRPVFAFHTWLAAGRL